MCAEKEQKGVCVPILTEKFWKDCGDKWKPRVGRAQLQLAQKIGTLFFFPNLFFSRFTN